MQVILWLLVDLFLQLLCNSLTYEHLSGCFILEDPSLGFSELFQVAAIAIRGDILRLMALVLGASRLLAIAKDISGLCHIAIGEVFLRFINHSIVLQLWGPF